jgi:hypothetical protein
MSEPTADISTALRGICETFDSWGKAVSARKLRAQALGILDDAVAREVEHAKAKHPMFASPHEAWAVLTEEAGELRAESAQLRRDMSALWSAVREHSQGGVAKGLEAVHFSAHRAMVEAMQVCAVARKALDGIRETETGQEGTDED